MPRRTRSARLALAAASSLLFACERAEAPRPAPQVEPPRPAEPAPPPPVAAPPPREARVLAPPRKVSAASQSDSEIALQWEASPDGAVSGYEVYRGDALAAKVPATRLLDRGLRHGTTFCYALRAYDAEGDLSERTKPVCAQTLDTTPPSPPPQLKAAVRPGNNIAVTWGPSTDDVGVVGYEVMRGNDRLATVTATSLEVRGVAPLKEQCFTVHALDRAGNRSAASGPACVTIPDTTPPTVPGRLAASAAGEHEVALSWDPATDDVGVARYELVRAGNPEGKGTPVPAEGVAARDRGLSAATRYCYQVRACDASGNCSAPSPSACATTPDLTPPSIPSAVAAKALSDREVELRWTASTDNVGVTGYEVHRGTKVFPVGAKETFVREAGLRPSQDYCYTVLALDAAGNRSPASPPACARPPDLTPPSIPARVAAVSVSSTQMFVAWDPSTDDVGVVGYEVMRGSSLIAKVAVTRARERALLPNQEYCYSVVALDAAGNRSPASPPACSTTADPSQLASPSDLRVVRTSPTSILLQWEPSEQGGVLYRVYAKAGTAQGIMKESTQGLTKDNTFTPLGRLSAKPNCFRVAAVDSEGRESPRSNEVCAASTATSAAAN